MCRSYGAFGLYINNVMLTMCRSYGGLVPRFVSLLECSGKIKIPILA